MKITLDRRIELTTSSNLEDLTGTEIVDEYTLDVMYEPQPQLSLLSEMGIFAFMYSPRQVKEDPAALETAPISTGPYRLVSYGPGREAVLEERDNYWGADVEGGGAPTIKNVTMRWGVEPSVGLAGLQAGDIGSGSGADAGKRPAGQRGHEGRPTESGNVLPEFRS